MLTEYSVRAQVVYESYRIVTASSPEEARELADSTTEVDLAYHHTLERETWIVELVGGEHASRAANTEGEKPIPENSVSRVE